MYNIDGNFILRVAPRFSGAKKAAQSRIVNSISTQFASMLDSYGINTKLRIAHFMGQVTHECAGFRTTEEFASGAAYEGRRDLGNTHKGDGKLFKGRGLIQLTGRFNYEKYANILGVDIDVHPVKAEEPVLALKIACEYWKQRNINAKSDNDDIIAVTRAVNGGLNGLDDRRKYYRKAKTILSQMDGQIILSNQPHGTMVLQRGSFGTAVGELQQKLKNEGYNITIDDDFGPATELAVVEFQKREGLVVDGIVGAKTWAKL